MALGTASRQVLGMTAEIYKRVAPDLSIYSVTGTLPATADERLASILRRAGFKPLPLAASPRIVFSIRAEAISANGGVFVREAIVQPDQNDKANPWILSWRQAVPKT